MPFLKLPTLKIALRRALGGPHMLGYVPVLTLFSYWAAGEFALYMMAIGLPILLALTGQIPSDKPIFHSESDGLTGLPMRDGLISWADATLPRASKSNREVAVIALVVDDMDDLEERFGRNMRDKVTLETADRIKNLLRDEDVMARLGPGLAIGVSNVRPPETENLLQLSRRIQSVFDAPFSDESTRIYCSMSLGIASECHVKHAEGTDLVVGAQRACELAAMSGPGSVRVFTEGLSSRKPGERDRARELSNALESGEIFAWFQPQVKSLTGAVSGFEALARWDHPDRGLLAPNSFLSDIDKAGLSQRLAEVILKQALTALNAWDAAGFSVPTISVNFSSEELRNPRLPDYVRWELDRHNISPDRLVVEVLESVVAESSEDVISRTLNSLSRIGCRIDLDDFGTGFTSFINIRRFSVGRIKIDRSLVNHVDRDEDQLKMISALLAFSERLGINALAEGVETEGEVATLRDLGCEEIQGYVTARPMSLGETLLWLEENAPPNPKAIKLRRVK
ncbi:MAG: GGDEF domain-containing protein [Silicimonas sp.]|nr:GGDEF domain-containing protein [Silicimonas sp.]